MSAPKKASFVPPKPPELLHHDEFSFVGVFDDHDDGALRIAMAQSITASTQHQPSTVIGPQLVTHPATTPVAPATTQSMLRTPTSSAKGSSQPQPMIWARL